VNLDPQGQIPFEGTIFLPSQMAALASSRPEQRLLGALLEAAWETLSKYVSMRSKRAQRLVEQELAWVNSDESAPFSFRFCCEHLDLDPETLRGGIHRALIQIRLGENSAGLKSMVRQEYGRTHKGIAA
jgi:hypothetical protein